MVATLCNTCCKSLLPAGGWKLNDDNNFPPISNYLNRKLHSHLEWPNLKTSIMCCSVSGGTTWHAAGLINPLKGGINDIKLSQYATELYPKLEQETDTSTGMRGTAQQLNYHATIRCLIESLETDR